MTALFPLPILIEKIKLVQMGRVIDMAHTEPSNSIVWNSDQYPTTYLKMCGWLMSTGGLAEDNVDPHKSR